MLETSTFEPTDVTILLDDITGQIRPLPTQERERLIQSGHHYSEFLPQESQPSAAYLNIYDKLVYGTDGVAHSESMLKTAKAIVSLGNQIIYEKFIRNYLFGYSNKEIVLVSIARSGTPIGVALKQYIEKELHENICDKIRKIKVPKVHHYTISIIRDIGIDEVAMDCILRKHKFSDIVFIDGWTGKGAIIKTLWKALDSYIEDRKLDLCYNKQKILGVLTDLCNVTEYCGSREDFIIPSSLLNSTVCGLMSRTILPVDYDKKSFHKVVILDEFSNDDHTYEFIDCISDIIEDYANLKEDVVKSGVKSIDRSINNLDLQMVQNLYDINDINKIKPGIGETTRVLLRRVPDKLIINEGTDKSLVAHLIELANEKNVPIEYLKLSQYNAIGIIKELADA